VLRQAPMASSLRAKYQAAEGKWRDMETCQDQQGPASTCALPRC